MAPTFAAALTEAKADETVRAAMLEVAGAQPDDAVTELSDVSAKDIRCDLESAATTLTLKQKGMVQRFIAVVLRSLGKLEVTAPRKRPHVALPAGTQAKRPAPTRAFPRRDDAPVPTNGQQAISDGEMQSDFDPDRTTVIIKGLPEAYTRDMLTELLDSEDFCACYDLIYIPHSFETRLPFGYAFVNFVSAEDAHRCVASLGGFEAVGIKGGSCLSLSFAESMRGLEAHIERYRSSPAMHEVVPDEMKPALYRGGIRVPFPAPTKPIRAPRSRRR